MPPPSCAGLTLAELVERTGCPRELLARVLANETQRTRARVSCDPSDGRYRLVAERFEPELRRALAQLHS